MKAIDAALMWLSMGIATIPILQGSKAPALRSWREFQTVLPRESQLRAWFSQTAYSIAIVTGWRGLVVVDFDDMEKHDKWLYGIATWEIGGVPTLDEEEHPDEEVYKLVQFTYGVATPRGGHHYYFFVDKPTNCLALGGVDVKSSGGYVLTPPSRGYSTRERPSRIQRLTSIEDLHLPGYAAAIAPQPRPLYDAFEDAVRPWVEGNGVSVEEIKKRWSVADVLEVTNSRAGRTWRTNCPLHGGTHLSLAVYSTDSWYCFVCNCGGDVINLYAALHKVDNVTAIRRMGK